MTARVKNSSGFSKLEMYTVSNGKLLTYGIVEENTTWKTIKIEHLSVKDGRVEIGFLAEGGANALCCVDDISLLKVQ